MTDTTDAGATKITLQRAIPVLASLDLEATQRFYAERIGFMAVARYPDYGICARAGAQLHFWLTDDADVPKGTSCHIDVLGIEALYEELRAAGVGNLIKFGERMDGPAREGVPRTPSRLRNPDRTHRRSVVTGASAIASRSVASVAPGRQE